MSNNAKGDPTLVPFKYSGRISRANVVRFCDVLAIRYSLKKEHGESKILGGYSDKAINNLAKSLFTKDELQRLKKIGKIPVKKSQIALLSKYTEIQVLDYKSENINFTVEFAPGNCYPCISSDLWLTDKNYFPGGFFFIDSSSESVLGKEITSFCRSSLRSS